MCISLNDKKMRYGRYRRCSRFARGVLALVLYLLGATVQAAYAPQVRMNSLDLPGAVWDSAEYMQVTDIPLHIRSFSSTLQPVQIARTLAAHIDIFQRILTSKHKIVLSGLQPGWHWLAHIDATPAGSRGYVSALYVDAARLSSDRAIASDLSLGALARDPVHKWLPLNTHRRFGHRVATASQALTQHVYSVPDLAPRVLTDVGLGLASQGWQADTLTKATGGPHIWSRTDQVLTLFAYPEPRGTTVLVHHSRTATEAD